VGKITGGGRPTWVLTQSFWKKAGGERFDSFFSRSSIAAERMDLPSEEADLSTNEKSPTRLGLSDIGPETVDKFSPKR